MEDSGQMAIGDGAVAPVVAPVDRISEPPLDAESDDGDNLALAGLVGLLAVIGLGGAGFLMMRRRRSRQEEPVYEEVETSPAEDPTLMEPAAPVHVAGAARTARRPEPVIERAPRVSPARPRPSVAVSYQTPATAPSPATENREAPAATPAMASEADELPASTSPFVHNRYYKGKAPEDRPIFVMPEGPVPTGERRDALLHRMIAARPDADNPYTSPKRRLRRARALLNERERMLREQAVQPFDYRDYKPTEGNRPARTTPVPHMA